MIQKSMAVFLLLLSPINPISATPLLKNIITQKTVAATNSKVQHAQSNPLYTDFSGIWVSSKCLGEPSFTLKIENTYDSIAINDEELPIGSMQTLTNSGVSELTAITTDSDIVSAEWINTKLVIKSISIKKSFDLPGNTGDTHMYSTMFHASYEMDNGQLLLKMNIAEYKDLQRIDVSQPTCVFTKTVE